MVQKVEVVLVDDIDGSVGHETVSFGLDGKTYEIDLSKTNAKRLRKALESYVAVARKTGSTKTKRSRSRSGEPAKIREWARSNGHKVPERGRIPGEVKQAYEQAHAA